VTQGLQDPSAKVRWAACQALGQMCTDLGPIIQEKQHARMLPGLMAVMDDFSQPRVQARVCPSICLSVCVPVCLSIESRGGLLGAERSKDFGLGCVLLSTD
jgi:HEAT repeat